MTSSAGVGGAPVTMYAVVPCAVCGGHPDTAAHGYAHRYEPKGQAVGDDGHTIAMEPVGRPPNIFEEAYERDLDAAITAHRQDPTEATARALSVAAARYAKAIAR